MPAPAAQPDLVLPSAISRIDLTTPLLATEIEALLRPFIGKTRVGVLELEQAQGRIWDLCRKRGRLTRVELRLVPASAADTGSTLQATVHEISVRTVKVEQEGDGAIDPSVLDQILDNAKEGVAAGEALDLDRLDSRIKRRVFLRDVGIRVALLPVGPNQVDVNVLVRTKPVPPLGFLLQYDNYGMKAYGRDRLTAGLSIAGRVLPGDQIDLIGVKTTGMDFRRLGYEFAVPPLGARMHLWHSQVDYVLPATAEGETSRWGGGLSFPLRIDDTAVWTAQLNYVQMHQVDRLTNRTPTGDKQVRSLQGRFEADYFLSAAQSLRLQAGWTHGQVDLSSLPAALAQDRVSARTHGDFDKLEWAGSWSTLFGRNGAWDARIAAKGQFASRNLDQSEKLALGGTTGVRAYGPSEALGDEGHVVNVELGYRPTDGLRMFAFYDMGHIRRHRQPWMVEAVPQSYGLRGAGVGLAFSYQSLVGSLSYARQLGANPGLLINGLDSDGSGARHRLWLSLTLWL